jgi:hypothetical protein
VRGYRIRISRGGRIAGKHWTLSSAMRREQTHALSAEFGAFMVAIEDVTFDQAQKWWTPGFSRAMRQG